MIASIENIERLLDEKEAIKESTRKELAETRTEVDMLLQECRLKLKHLDPVEDKDEFEEASASLKEAELSEASLYRRMDKTITEGYFLPYDEYKEIQTVLEEKITVLKLLSDRARKLYFWKPCP